jgi:hypothetical protein
MMNSRYVVYSVLAMITCSVAFFVNPTASIAAFKLGKPPYSYVLATGLIAHWTFDGSEIVSGVVRDRTANANNGNPINISSTTFYTSGKIGQGIRLDGLNDYVTFGRITATEGASALTWSFWSYSQRFRNGDVFLSKASIFSSGSWQIAMSSGCITGLQLIVYIPTAAADGSTLGCAPDGSVATGVWKHYTIVFDGTGVANADRLKIYVDGAAVTVDFIGTIPAATITSTDVVTIGVSSALTLNSQAVIDDARIYSRALTATEASQLYRFGRTSHAVTSRTFITSGLSAHWTFDGPEIVAGSVRDRSTNANNGTTTGIATSTFYTAGKIGQALNFDGINDYVSTARTITYPITGCAWIFPVSQEGTTPEIIGSPAFKFRLVRNGANDYSVRITNDNGTVTTAASTISLNNWNHVCASVDVANSAILYINGASSNSGSIAAPGSSGSTNIGMSTGATTNPFTGKIDDVRIYNRVLTPEEVRQLYFSGK